MTGGEMQIVEELRELIALAAPDADRAAPVREVGADEPLDGVIPFSSVIVLGVVVAVEDRYGVRVTKQTLARAAVGGITLRALARMVTELRTVSAT